MSELMQRLDNLRALIQTPEFLEGKGLSNDLRLNLAENCVPEEFMEMDIFNYQVFLDMRRRMMAQYIREYYESLV